MEIEANELFDAYRELYFEGGTSSVYLWDLEKGFAGCFLIKKSKLPLPILLRVLCWIVANLSVRLLILYLMIFLCHDHVFYYFHYYKFTFLSNAYPLIQGVTGSQFVKEGCWDSIHIIETLQSENPSKATYKLTTTVMLHMSVEKFEVGNSTLSGSLTRQVKELIWGLWILKNTMSLDLEIPSSNWERSGIWRGYFLSRIYFGHFRFSFLFISFTRSSATYTTATKYWSLFVLHHLSMT